MFVAEIFIHFVFAFEVLARSSQKAVLQADLSESQVLLLVVRLLRLILRLRVGWLPAVLAKLYARILNRLSCQ